ncbi:ABC-type branched-subunit amino acid transport system substrate-binding protein [Variovorax sp. W2I14]
MPGSEIPESKVMFDHMGGLLGKGGQKFFTAVNQPPGKVDLKNAAEELKPKEVQAIVMFCPGKMCADLVGEIRKQGGAPTFYTISSAGDVFGELAAQGVSIAVTQVMPYPWTVGAFPIVAKYQQAMKAADNTRIGYWSLEGYISAQVLVEGLRRINGTPSRASMLAAMQNLGHLNLGGFDLTIDQNDRSGSHFTDLTLARSGGKYIR